MDKIYEKTANHRETRVDYVDWAKGIMILFVIAGHIGDRYFERTSYLPLRSFIYSFHVPLFFLLSGYLMGMTRHKLQSYTFRTWLWKKIRTLVIPFVVFGLLIYRFIDPIETSPLDLTALHQLMVTPDHGGAWFLISLFCIQVVCYPIFRYAHTLYAWIVPCLYLVINMMFDILGSVSWFYCNFYHYASFLAGYLLFKYKESILRPDVSSIALIGFVVAELFYPNPLLCTVLASVALLFACKQYSHIREKKAEIISQTLTGCKCMMPIKPEFSDGLWGGQKIVWLS